MDWVSEILQALLVFTLILGVPISIWALAEKFWFPRVAAILKECESDDEA